VFSALNVISTPQKASRISLDGFSFGAIVALLSTLPS